MNSGTRREVFEREGWVLVGGFIEARTIESLREASSAILALASGLHEGAIIRGAEMQVQSRSGRSGEPAVAPGVLRKVVFPSKLAPAMARLRRDPRVLALMRELGLPEPHCAVDQLNLKAPGVGTGFPWHQDSRFVSGRQRDVIERDGGANLVIALDRADAGNGGFEVLGRTHLLGARPFDYDTSATNAGVFDESRRELIALEPGDAVAFHPHLAHGSGPNPTERPRRLVALWFLGRKPTGGEGAGARAPRGDGHPRNTGFPAFPVGRLRSETAPGLRLGRRLPTDEDTHRTPGSPSMRFHDPRTKSADTSRLIIAGLPSARFGSTR